MLSHGGELQPELQPGRSRDALVTVCVCHIVGATLAYPAAAYVDAGRAAGAITLHEHAALVEESLDPCTGYGCTSVTRSASAGGTRFGRRASTSLSA
jgi:hypothetical protein